MLTVIISPQVGATAVTASWDDPVITVNGESVDLSVLDDGEVAQNTSSPLVEVSRDGSDYVATIIKPVGSGADLSERFPSEIKVNKGVII